MIIIAKLYFRYGTMSSSKTAELLMCSHKYEEQGKQVLIFKPVIDTRSSKSKVESRVGISHDCVDIEKDFDFLNNEYISQYKDLSCILIDEAQWLMPNQVEQLVHLIHKYNVPVIAYGLKNSYVKGELFQGSQALLFYAESIEEIKSTCEYCNHKSTMHLRIINGKPIYSGNSTHVGDTKECNDYYVSVCSEHYFNPILKKGDKNK